MSLRLWRFASIISTGISLCAAFAHLLELPPKRRYERSLYVRLHRTLYPNFGRIAGPTESLAVLVTAALAWKLRGDTSRLNTIAASSLGAAHALFWTLVQPANVTMANWPMDHIPENWSNWRDRWEYTHAIRAFLILAAFSTLAWSALPNEDATSR